MKKNQVSFRDLQSFGTHYLANVAKWKPRQVAMSVSEVPRMPPVVLTLHYDKAESSGPETSIGYQFKVSRKNKVQGRKKHSINVYADHLPPSGMVMVPKSQGLRLLGLSLAA